MLSDITALGLAAAAILCLAQTNPIKNEGRLKEVMDFVRKPSKNEGSDMMVDVGTKPKRSGVEPRGIVKGALAPVEGIRTRTPLTSCGLPQGVGISTRLLPPKDGEKFDDAEFLALDAQGLVSKNFLTARARIGGFEMSSGNRIKNLQFRAEPVIERSINVGNTPFNVSPHFAHVVERPFELETVPAQAYKDAMQKTKFGGA